MIRKFLLNFYAVCLLFVAGCNSGDGDNFSCPTIDDNTTWTSFGGFVFENSGNDSTARRIISECGWHVHNNHNGGIGNTLQVASPGEEVILVWAFNQFHAYRVTTGWTGNTERDVTIGDHITFLYGQYPGFMTNDGITHTLTDGNDINVSVTSDVNGFIDEMIVGMYFRR